ncbi:lipopolysaccharide biosynthesis protein [Algoriphagus yeomjeoni]|uniref:lipopolysaccharide biosynthesis protein n=1 Tax=Algoriphagus yeomjeoni TaxID=291403 RepID=UPI003CE5C092
MMNLNVDFFKKIIRGKHSKSVIFLLILNVVGIIVNFLLVPLLIGILNSEKYGIWLTITSLIAWVNFLDFGLGHGLRNKLAESISINDFALARSYVSTSYFSIFFLVLFFLLISISIVPIVNWSMVFNASPYLNDELQKVVFWIFFIYSFQFLFKLITSILQAIQKPEFASLVNVSGLGLSLLVIWMLTISNTDPNLWLLGVILVGSPILTMGIANVLFFTGEYKFLRPSWDFFNSKLIKVLFSLGGAFFIIQLTSIFLFQSNNILIAHAVGPEAVTDFNIAFKYLGVVSTVFYLINMPFWSASTEAFSKKNYSWINEKIKNLNLIWILFVLSLVGLLFIAPWFYHLWLGDKVIVKFDLLILLSIYYLLYMQWSIYGSFINGSGKVRFQMIATLLLALIHIPLAYKLGSKFGVNGIVFSMIFHAFLNILWPRIQLNKLVNEKAYGIWNK